MLNTSPYLPRRLDALDEAEADQGPGRQQGQSQLPVKATKVVDTTGNVEGLAVPEVSGGCAPLAFWLHYFGGREAVKRVICKDPFYVEFDHLKTDLGVSFSLQEYIISSCGSATMAQWLENIS